MNKSYIKNITNFLKNAYQSIKDGNEGCWYHNLDGLLYIVASRNDEDEIVAKIAYNCDSLQCDYDLDWYMPYYENGEVAYTEISLSKGIFRKDAEWFYGNYKAMLKEIKLGHLICK